MINHSHPSPPPASTRSLAIAFTVACLTFGAGAPAWALEWDHQDIKYGDEDPSRQFLNIHLADGAGPHPVLLYAHANGGNAYDFADTSAALVTGAGYSIVSWESLEMVSTPAEANVGVQDLDLVWDWLQANASAYALDPSRIVVGGRSRGSVLSWRKAHSGDAAIVGAYFYNALPDGAWQSPNLWNPLDDVTESSPPLYLAFGPAPDDGDPHNPANLVPVVDRYGELGMAQDVTLTSNMDADGLNPWHFFPSFVEGLADPSGNGGGGAGAGGAAAGSGGNSPGAGGDAGVAGGPSTTPESPSASAGEGGCNAAGGAPGAWWLLVPLLFGLRRRR